MRRHMGDNGEGRVLEEALIRVINALALDFFGRGGACVVVEDVLSSPLA